MQICWRFYRFDHDRYLQIRPALRAATQPADFAPLAESPELETLVIALAENTLSIPAIRQEYVRLLCCKGAALGLDRGFSRCVAILAARPQTEDAAELLTGLLTGYKNVEPWLAMDGMLCGFLTPEETIALRTSYVSLHDRRHRRKRHGIFEYFFRFMRLLFDQDALQEDMLRLLGDLIESAVRQGQGIAVFAA